MKIISPEGKVSYTGMEYIEAKVALISMLVFPDKLDELSREHIVTNAISEVAVKQN